MWAFVSPEILQAESVKGLNRADLNRIARGVARHERGVLLSLKNLTRQALHLKQEAKLKTSGVLLTLCKNV